MERLSIKEMRFQLSLRGISTLGMSERIELEKALQDNPVSSSSSSTASVRPAPLPSTSLKRPLPTSDSTLVSSSASTGTSGEKKSKKPKKVKKTVDVEPEPLMLFWSHYEDSEGEFLKKRKTKLDTSDFNSGWFFTDSPSEDLPSWFLKCCGQGGGKPDNFPPELFSSFSFLTKRDDLCLDKNGGGDGFLKRKLIVKQVGKEQGGDYCSAELGADALYSFYREGDVETAALITSKAKSHEDAKTMLLQRIGINYEVIRLDKAAAQKSSTSSKQTKKPTATTKTKTKKEETRYSEDNDDDEDDDEDDEDDDEDEGEY